MKGGWWWGLALVVLLAGVAASILAVTTQSDGATSLPPDVGVIEGVIDGDTIDIDIGGRTERVRLIGIDTPERHTDTGDPECMAEEAREFSVSQLTVGTEVRLERDVVGRDDYGRLLAYVFRRADGLFVNEAIVAGGYAKPLTITPNDAYADRFVAAATAAEAARIGLWAACAG